MPIPYAECRYRQSQSSVWSWDTRGSEVWASAVRAHVFEQKLAACVQKTVQERVRNAEKETNNLELCAHWLRGPKQKFLQLHSNYFRKYKEVCVCVCVSKF